MTTFKDKIVFITGASSGIGAACARAFAKEGATVIATARRLDKLNSLVTELQSAGCKALALQCDVKDESDIRAAVARVHQQFGSIDIVVANAGFSLVNEFVNMKIEDFQRQFDVNVFGVLRTIYATLDDLKQNRGQLVLLGSVASYISVPKGVAYSMSKFAIRSLAENLYAELITYGIAVTLISPGFIATEIRHIDNYGIYHEEAHDPIPQWLRLSADTTAKKILNAVKRKKRERIITIHGKLSVFLLYIFPGFIPRFFRWLTKRANKKLEFI